MRGQKETFSSTQVAKYFGDVVFNLSWYLSPHVVSKLSYQALLSSLPPSLSRGVVKE